jgi:TPR repeat protein
MRRHVEDGLPEAFGYLGDAYRAGELSLVKSEKKACRLFARGVESGDVTSMVNLGQMYKHGLGVKRDLKKATQLMRMASESGLAMAQQNLGGLLAMQAMHVEAVQYFTRAAKQGFLGSFYSLGICHECGEGVPKDIRKALNWYKKAADAGFEPAVEALTHLRTWAIGVAGVPDGSVPRYPR